MSKKILTLALAASLLSGSLLGTTPAFAAGKKVVSLNILNEKSVYKVFDMDFLQVEATFEDGTKSIIPNNDLIFKTYSYQLDQGTNTWGYKDSTTISYTDSGTMLVKGEGIYKIEADLKEDPTVKTQKEVSTDKTSGITSLQNSYVLSSSTVARSSGLAEIYFILPDLKNAPGQKYKIQDSETGQVLFETGDSFYLYNQVVPNKTYKFRITLVDGGSEKDSFVKEVTTFNSVAPKVNNISYDTITKRLTVNANSATNEPLYYQFNNNDMTTNSTFETTEALVDIKVIDRQGNVSESIYNTNSPVQNPTLKSLSITDPIDKISLRKDQVFDLAALKFDLLKTDGTKVSNVPVQYSVETGKESLVSISGSKVVFAPNTPVGTSVKIYANYTSGSETVRTSLDFFYYSDIGSGTTPTPTPGTDNGTGNNNNSGTTTSPLKSVGILNSQYIYPLSQKNGLDLSKITFQATYEDGKVKTLAPTTGMKFESKTGSVPVTLQNGWLTVPSNTTVNTIIEVNASYTEGSVTKTVPMQVIVVNDNTQSSTLKEMSVVDQKYIYTLNTKTGFDLNTISFLAKYEDGTSKRILPKDMSFKWVSGASDILVTNGILTLKNTVPNSSLIEVQGSYLEGGVTKTTTLHFIATNDSTQTNSILNNFKVTNSTGLINVDANVGYDLSKLNFEASYLDGTNKKIKVSDISFTSNTKDVNITTNNGILKMDSKIEDRKVVDVIATYKEGNVSKTLTLQFINTASTQAASLLSIDNVVPQYEINAGQNVELKNMKFKVYYSDSKIVEKTGDDQTLEKVVQVKDQSKLDMTKFQAKTIQFNSTAKVGDQVEIEVFYTEQGKKVSTKVSVKLVETATTPIPNTPSKFTDIKGHWAEKEIIEMANKNFVTGYINGSFQPNKAITRGEVASIVARYLNLPKGDKVPFTDVIEVDWNYEDIAKVYQSGIFKGYENNTFKPKEKITREELAVLLVRMHEYRYGVTDVSNNTLPFKDETKIGKWAISSVKKAQGLSLILGKENYRFAPRDNATRAEVTAILYRSMETK